MKKQDTMKEFERRTPICKSGVKGRWAVAAFFAGMALTAGLAQTTLAADILNPRVIHGPVAPAPPAVLISPGADNSPDSSNTVKPSFYELVLVTDREDILSG